MKYAFADCKLDTDSREFLRHGAEVHLSPKAYDLLRLLVEQRPRVLNKAELMQALWPDTFVVEGNLHVIVAELRGAIGSRAIAAAVIKTHHGIGYSFGVEAREAQSRPRQSLSGPRVLLKVGRRLNELGPGDNEVGRDAGCDICINDPSVSRGHARITLAGPVATVIDHGSKNGTKVNGKLIKSAVELRDGDELMFGQIAAQFQIERRESDSTLTLRIEGQRK
jgi:DNA-binding winged helix-turn-helix (wHTH) protein